MAHDVIISYSTHDKAVADASCAALEVQRIRCWIAPRDVLAGTEYGEAILQGIEGSKVILLVFSAKSNDSTYCKKEVERAVSLGKIIVPFRIEETLPSGAMSFFLGNTHWLDALTPPLELRIDELIASIARLLGPSGDPTPSSETSNVVRKAETDAQRFEQMFAVRPDVIAEVEAEAAYVPIEITTQFERLLARLEVVVCEPKHPGDQSAGARAHRDRLLCLIDKFDANEEAAAAFVSASQQQGIGY